MRFLKYVLLSCASLSIMCTAIISPALPMMKKEFANIENAEILIKMCATVPNIFIAIFSPLFGLLFARLKSKRLFLIVFFVIYTVSGSITAVLSDVRVIIAARAILGISIAAIMTCGLDLISKHFKGYERNKVLAAQTSVMSIGSIVFTMLSGYLVDFNWRYAFLLYLTGAILIPLVLFTVKDDFGNENDKSFHAKDDEGASKGHFAKFFGNGLPSVICVIAFVNMVFFYMVPIQLPFVLKEINPEINAKMISFVITMEVIVSAFFATKYKRLKKNRSFEAIFVISFAIMALSHIGVSYSRTYYAVLFWSGIYGLGMSFMMPNIIVWLVNSVESKTRGFWIGMMTAGAYFGKFASPIVLLPIVNHVGIFKSYRVAGVVMLFIAIFVFFITDGMNAPRKNKLAK